MKQKEIAFHKAIGFAHASIDQVCGITNPQWKFLCWIFEKWVMLPVGYDLLNSFRYGDGGYSENSIRDQFSRKINFSGWFDAAFGKLRQKKCIATFDPSYILKGGKKTYGKGRFWSGKDQ